MTNLVGLSGYARAGKGSVVQLSQILLQTGDEEREVRQVSFASALKKLARERGWDGVKDEKGRKLLQDLGMEKRRDIPTYWIDIVEQKIRAMSRENPPPKLIFVPDTRFKNEAGRIRDLGGEIWRVERYDHSGMPYDNLLTLEQRMHPSERDLDGWPFDYVIRAKNMTELFNGVKGGLRRLGQM